MSFIKTKLRQKTADGADTIYIETSSTLVMRDSGHSVETDLAAVESTVASKVGITGTVSDGALAAFDGAGNIKTASVSMSSLSTAITNSTNHIASSSNPHGVTAAQVGAYTTSQTDSAIATAKSEAISGANAATGVTAETYGLTANATPAYGGTFVVPKFTVNSAGKITEAGNYTVTVPALPSISFVSGLTGSSAATSSGINVTVTAIDATKLTGTVPLTSIPKGAISELKVVADDAAMLALTINDVQNGDVVKLNDTGVMYYVKDDSALGTAAAFEEFSAALAASVAWADVTDKPNFANVATSGSYNDLSNKPTIPSATSTINPSMDGTVNVGTSTEYARADHIHPTDTSRAPTSHASSSTTYGKGTNSNYGHVKLSDDTDGTAAASSGGTAATPKAVADALTAAKSYAATSTHVHGDITNDGKLDTASVIVVTDPNKNIVAGSIDPANIVITTDARLSDSRTPKSHTHGSVTNDGKLGTASRIVVTDSSKNITAGSIDPSNLVVTTDSRLSDARTPTSHAHGSVTNDGKLTAASMIVVTDANKNVVSGDIAPSDIVLTSDSRLSDSRTPLSHTHGSITNDGKVGTTSGYSVYTTTGGAVTAGSLSTSDPSASGTGLTFIATASQDSKGKMTLTKKTVADMGGAGTDTAGTHGLVPAPAAGAANRYLRSDGTWQVPPNDNTNTTYTFTTGTDNGKITVTPSEGDAYQVAVKGLGSAAYTASTAYAASSHAHGNITSGGALDTASRIVVTDSSKNITTGSIDPANLVVTTDSRLSDARTPTSHTHGNIANGGTLGTASRIVVTDADKKITTGTIDPSNLVQTDDSRLSDARTPTSHAHGNLTNDGKVGSTSGYSVYTTTGGAVTAGSLSTSDPTASGTSTTFIATASQDAKGKMTLTKASLPTASSSVAGITKLGASGGAATFEHTHSAQVDVTGSSGYLNPGAKISVSGPSGNTSYVASTATTFTGASDITIPITEIKAGIVTGLATVATSGNYSDLSGKPTIPSASSTSPKASGTAAVGSETAFARGDHVHPAQTTITGNAGTATTLKNSQNFSITGGATAAAVSFNGSGAVALNVTSLDATKLSGLVPLASIPQGAVERLVTVADASARLLLTATNVQLGDVVKQTDTGLMYYVVDESKLSADGTTPGTEAAFEVFTAGAAASVPWSGVTDKPSSYTPSSHTHGNITNAGALQSSDITVASGDKLVVTDSSNSSKVARTSISFDGSTETKALTPKGTWVSFAAASHTHSYSADTHGHGNITNAGLLDTASRIVVTDSSKAVTTGSIDPANLVVTTDSRLSDARTPTSHTHGSVTNDGKLGTASRIVVTDSSKNITVGSINPSNLVVTTDSRLSDARTPTSHTHGSLTNDGKLDAASVIVVTDENMSVVSGTIDPSNIVLTDDSRLSDSRTPTSHTHGNIANGGTLGTASRIVVTDSSKKITTGSIDPSNLVVTTDSRLSDARTPTSHAHGSLTNDGKIGTTSGYSVYTTTDGAVTAGSLSTSDPSASGTSTTFIKTASQDAKGKMTLTKASLPTASSSTAGIMKLGASGGAATYEHTHAAQTSVTGNAGTATTLQTARYLDGAYFNGNANVSHYASCASTATTTALTATIAPAVGTAPSLVQGFRVFVKFDNTITVDAPTMSVNSTTAKAIHRKGKSVGANYFKANGVYELVYDGTQWNVVTTPGDVYTVSSATSPSVDYTATGDMWYEPIA